MIAKPVAFNDLGMADPTRKALPLALDATAAVTLALLRSSWWNLRRTFRRTDDDRPRPN